MKNHRKIKFALQFSAITLPARYWGIRFVGRNVKIHQPRDRSDARGAAVAHNRAWRVAYDGLLPDDVLAGFDPDPDPETVDDWHDRLAAAGDLALVARVGDDVVGYALLQWADTKPFVDPDAAGLKEIYVRPDHWGEGAGSELLAAGIDRVPDEASALVLGMFADNEVGQRFYEARGFEAVDETTTEVAGESYPITVYERPLGE
jgi:GNAT superfamily N-acetyltransferase